MFDLHLWMAFGGGLSFILFAIFSIPKSPLPIIVQKFFQITMIITGIALLALGIIVLMEGT